MLLITECHNSHKHSQSTLTTIMYACHVTIAGYCYKSDGPGINSDKHRCATERVEGVTSLDILYSDFHDKIMGIMESSGSNGSRSCSLNKTYTCPNGEPGCSTRYL